jgi:hypothetical protein
MSIEKESPPTMSNRNGLRFQYGIEQYEKLRKKEKEDPTHRNFLGHGPFILFDAPELNDSWPIAFLYHKVNE